LPSPA
jgi:protein JBTS26